jgi:PadR family transcriptional regulator, regulatory protein PadR
MTNDAQMLKGILEGCILTLLVDGELYGYKIVESLKSYGFTDVQEATVYPILTRLNKKGLLCFEKRPSDLGPPRKYYSLTKEGHTELLRFSTGWNNISKKVDNMLKEKLS